MKTETQKLKDALKKLKAKNDTGEIFRALVSIEDDWLLDEVKLYLTIDKGLNVLKMDGLDKQMKFEEAIETIYPFDNDRQQNLFLTA